MDSSSYYRRDTSHAPGRRTYIVAVKLTNMISAKKKTKKNLHFGATTYAASGALASIVHSYKLSRTGVSKEESSLSMRS